MIIKERDRGEHDDSGLLAKAGARAEEQMAFYLRRAFSQDEDILVFNDLRFHDDMGDTCQIDHLILHWYGFIFVESKSVTSGIKVNGEGEWTRYWNAIPQGMPSPILQARRQMDFLMRALNANAEALSGKLFGLIQKRFSGYQWDVLVAISDQGTITRDSWVPELHKADQIPDRIKAIVAGYKLNNRGLNVLKDPLIWMDDKTRSQVITFLLEHHDPKISSTSARQESTPELVKKAIPPPPSLTPAAKEMVAEPSASTKICPRCGNPLVERIARKGANANKTFWGCSSFPKCRFVEANNH